MKLSKILLCFCVLIVLFLSVPRCVGQTVDDTVPEQAKVGIFYYVWWSTTDNSSWDSTVVDRPVFDFYDSDDSAVIGEQLKMIEDLGVDFVLVSWWGTHDEFGRFTDSSAKEVFQVAYDSQTSLKFAILVEPFEIEDDGYDYGAIYDQVYYDFFLPYSSLYYHEDRSPLICFYNDPGNPPSLTGKRLYSDGRFTCRVVGQESYTDWMYLDLVMPVVREDQVSVTPRYDDSRLADRIRGIQVDPRLVEGVYDSEWQKAIQLWQMKRVDTILISSWNEYYERTEIEPHYDATAADDDPYFLYAKTMDYVARLREAEVLDLEYEMPMQFPASVTYSTLLHSSINVPEYPSVFVFFALFVTGTIGVFCFKRRCRG